MFKRRFKLSNKDIYAVSRKSDFIINIFILLFTFMCILPFLLVIIISFTDEKVLSVNGYSFFPEKLSPAAYEYLFKTGKQLLQSYIVTTSVTVVGTLISLFLTAMFAYAISRKTFVLKKFFTFVAFFTMLFNGGLVPTYMVITNLLHLKNNYWVLVLPLAVNAFYIIILRTFFTTTIPDSVIESARIDGASEMQTFIRIVLPISLPGLATIGLFSALGYWNEWFTGLLYIDGMPELTPLQLLLIRIQSNMEFLNANSLKLVGAADDIRRDLPSESTRMALVVLATGPIVLAYPFFQKYFVKGLTVGSVKG